MQKQIVLVVEPNCVIRAGLRHIAEHAGYETGGCVASVAELLEQKPYPTSCFVLLRASGSDDAKSSIREIKSLMPSAYIVVLGGIDNLRSAAEAVQCGASVCLGDDADAAVLLKAMELAQSGVATMSLFVGADTHDALDGEDLHSESPLMDMPAELPVSQFSDLRKKASYPSFSRREAAILQLLQEGAPNKHIARQLSLTEATVKVHLKSILRKIRVNNRTQAAVWAMSQNVAMKPGMQDAPMNGEANDDHQLRLVVDWRDTGTQDSKRS